MNPRSKIHRHACSDRWTLVLALSGATLIVGCGGESGPDPSIKVETGKSIEESTTKGRARSGVTPKEAAPIQRTKAAPG